MTRDRAAPLVRPLAFAGRWYDADPVRLGRQVDDWLDAAGDEGDPPVALLAPHAGLRYSGAVAGAAYARLRRWVVDVVVLIGPSHYLPFPGCGLLREGALATPWAPHPVHTEAAARLAASSWLLAEERRDTHAGEHSLELHLPFLARVQPGVPVLPILMGEQTRSVAFALGDLLGAALAGLRAVVVASSDLSHYHHATRAAALDGRVLEQLASFDHHGLMHLLEADPGHACGGGPLVAAMRVARHLGATRGHVLHYADSGDASGDKERVVGYAAAAFTVVGTG